MHFSYGMSCTFKRTYPCSILLYIVNVNSGKPKKIKFSIIVFLREPDFGCLVFKEVVKSMRGSKIDYVPANWIIQEWYYTGSVLIWSQNASCILLYLVTQLADRERQQLSPFKYYPYHAEKCISKLYDKINTKQTAAYMYEQVVWMPERGDDG